MAYVVKEIFGPTLQGEGAYAGAAAVFLRFAGCNLACAWCDTDFSAAGAERLEAGDIVRRLRERDLAGSRRVIVTGGEPTLQWDAPLAAALAGAGFRVHMETNGTRALGAPVDWLTVSPKPQFHPARETLVLRAGDELKLVVDETVDDAALERAEPLEFGAFFVQPCAGPGHADSVRRATELALRHARWRLSLQLHKLIGLP